MAESTSRQRRRERLLLADTGAKQPQILGPLSGIKQQTTPLASLASQDQQVANARSVVDTQAGQEEPRLAAR